MFRKLSIDLLFLAILILLGFAAYRLAPLLVPQSDRSLPLSSCDPGEQSFCQVSLPEGAMLEFSISPQPIPVLKPLRVEVRLEGIDAQRVEVDFAGTGMKMGYNRPSLQKNADGVFRGNASLPVCITGGMNWKATVLVETATERLAVPFQFETGKTGTTSAEATAAGFSMFAL